MLTINDIIDHANFVSAAGSRDTPPPFNGPSEKVMSEIIREPTLLEEAESGYGFPWCGIPGGSPPAAKRQGVGVKIPIERPRRKQTVSCRTWSERIYRN